MNSDALSSIVYLFSAVPTSPPHDQLDVTIYENGLPASSLLATPVLSESDLSGSPFCPPLFVAIRSVLVHAAIRWPDMIPAYQIADSLSDALYMMGSCQVVFCQSEFALLVSGDSAQDIISRCHYHNERIHWETLMALPMVYFQNDPIEQFLNLEECHMLETAVYEPMVQPNDLVNEYDGPLFDDWNWPANITSYEPSSSTASTCSSPFPETPVNFGSDLPHVVSPMSTLVHDLTSQEEQQINVVTQIIQPGCPTSPGLAAAPSPLSEYESPPSSRCSSTTPSSQSSGRDSTSPILGEEIFQAPVKAVGKKIRRTRTGAIRKKKTKSKEKHFCCYCKESFTRDHDAERHQRTCKANPNCSQKEQCKVCAKPLPVRLDARRRHWGTLECSDAARKRGYSRMDEEAYEFI